MFRAQCCAVVGFGLMLAAASTEARELEFSVENRITGDSNVFRSESDRVADGYYSLAPRIVVREDNSKLNYEFSYRPTYETYFETSGIDGFDHWGKGVLSWRPTAVDTVGFSAQIISSRRLRFEDQAGPGGSVEETDRDRVQRSDVELSYRRALNQAFSIQLSGTFNDYDYSSDRNLDSRAYSSELGMQYAFNAITGVGLSGSFLRRENSGVGFQITTDTDIWNVAASVQRALTPTLKVSVQAGPSFISTKQKLAGLDTTSRTTSYFAAASIDKSWRRSNARASYSRAEGSGGSDASTSITDNLTLTFDHHLSRRWSFRVLGSWLQSEEISRAIANEQETTQYRVSARFLRNFTRQLSVVGKFSFFFQDQEGFGSSDIGSLYSGFLSLRYTFEPVVF